MFGKRWLYLGVILLATLALQQCIGLRITDIWDDPEIAIEGGTAAYTIVYKNTSSEDTYRDITLALNHDTHLNFVDATPAPSARDENEREITWDVGTLGPGHGGTIVVTFLVAEGFPTEVYQLQVTVQIAGITGKGVGIRTSRDKETAYTLIEGHPTPTPRPTPTPAQ